MAPAKRSCCVTSCGNYSLNRPDVTFYKLPSAAAPADRRLKWLQAIKRCDIDEFGNPDPSKLWNPTSKYIFVCSDHFVSLAKNDNPDHMDFVPSVFPHSAESLQQRATRVERADRAQKRCALHTDVDFVDVTAPKKAKNPSLVYNLETLLANSMTPGQSLTTASASPCIGTLFNFRFLNFSLKNFAYFKPSSLQSVKKILILLQGVLSKCSDFEVPVKIHANI